MIGLTKSSPVELLLPLKTQIIARSKEKRTGFKISLQPFYYK